MKTVYTSQEKIAHLWANATQPHARCTNASFTTSTDTETGITTSTLLSYFTAIAYRVQSADPTAPPMFVIASPKNWSNTTAKHIRTAIAAVPINQHATRFIAVNNAHAFAPSGLRHATVERMRAYLELATSARSASKKAGYESEALTLAKDYNGMRAWVDDYAPHFTNEEVDKIDIEAVMGEDHRARVAAARAYEKTRRELRAAQLAELRAQWEHAIVAWRDHVTLPGIGHAITTLADDTPIRLSSDGTRIETMRNAEIPLAHAQQLWRVLQWDTLVKVAKALVRSKLGNYTIDEVKPNRDLIVGCHVITFKEMQLLAAKHPDLFPTAIESE